MSIKEKMMNSMMEKQMASMSADEKKEMMHGMMDKFFSSMTDDEKKDLMQEMMPKMMGSSEGNPMMGMMQMMMGKKDKDKDGMKMPWDMCGEMMRSMKETANTAKFATPELRGLFEEWCNQIELEIQEQVKNSKKVDAKKLAEQLSLSEESITYLLGLMAKKGSINYTV